MNHVEIDSSLERWSLHVFEGDFFYFHVDLCSRRVHEEFLDDVVLAVGVEDAVGQLSIKEIESLREIVLNRVAVASIILKSGVLEALKVQ